MAFPCNQFLSQEPGTNEEIKEFARGKYGAKFQLMDKVEMEYKTCKYEYILCCTFLATQPYKLDLILAHIRFQCRALRLSGA